MADRKYHLWRVYPTKPYHRFACTLVADESASDGFRIVDADPNVADVGFLHVLVEAMNSPMITQIHNLVDGVIVDESHWVRVKEPGHFEAAVRQVPHSVLRGVGRP